MRVGSAIGLLLVCAALAACRSTEVETVTVVETSSGETLREIVLTPTMPITIVVDTEGLTAVTVQIPEGHPDAGSYTSRTAELVENFRAVQESLGRPGVEASIQVNGKHEIMILSHSVTLQ